MHQKRIGRGDGSLLGGRILELLRIRSAQLGECQPCMQSRKHDSITDEDVACLLDVNGGDLTDQERLAVTFMDLLSADHHAIDADFYRQLAEVFTAAQIIELGFSCAESMGLHRFIHTLEVFGTERAGDRVLARPDRHPSPGVRPGRRLRLTESTRAVRSSRRMRAVETRPQALAGCQSGRRARTGTPH